MTEEHKRKISLSNIGKHFNVNPEVEKERRRKIGEAHRGMKHPWTSKRLRENQFGDKNPGWTGENASYGSIHAWLQKYKKRNYWCELGKHKIDGQSDFALIGGEYTRNLDDYVEACRSCHMKMDGIIKNIHFMRDRKTPNNI